MRRLMTKFWKEIAYLVGLFGLGFAQVSGLKVETFGMLYTGAGMAWLIVWLLRNRDPDHKVRTATDLSDHSVHQHQDRYLNDHWTRSYHH
ncbi:hypothetical protein [Leisingera sp. JC1]|uniref:hypothetical protein n=1 Tax=Leisingera sp. JC1 TaxID=1855282 RepID=UPI0008033495|nr:hypothetical protein [Leisingera sp. JC1]OBY26813.1 hypothetical protein A9D60_17645 [Leisingera sp. JC1]